MGKASGFTGNTMLAALLSVAIACGSVNTQEAAQSKAVRDRSRVLGLALMDDGTYQFRLCRLRKTYTAKMLANECINPLLNEDGTERVFNNVPEKPGTALAKFRNWAAAALAGTIAGFAIYKIGRFYVKTKARDRLVGKIRLERHTARVDEAMAKNDFELVTRLGEATEDSAVVDGKDFTNAIAFVENYSKKVEGNIETAQKTIETAIKEKTLSANIDKIQKSLQEASEVLQQKDSGFNLDSKPIQDLAQEIAALAKQADELRNAGSKDLDDKLLAMKRETLVIHERVRGKKGLRFQLSSEEEKALAAVADDDPAVAAALQNWKHSKAELSLLDGSAEMEKVLVKLKDGKDELVEKLLRIDDVVVMKNDPNHLDSGKKTVLQLKRDIEYRQQAIKEYRQAIKESGNKKDTTLSTKLDKALDEAEAALNERTKPYNRTQKNLIDNEQEKVDVAIKADPIAEKIEKEAKLAKAARRADEKDGPIASGLGKVGNSIQGKVKFLRGFPWIDEDTLKYSQLNKITITDEDKIVAKLAHDVKVEDVEVQKGVEKLSAQVVGISAFLSLPLTAWSRYLPAHALLSAEKSWTEVTGGYATAKRIDDMLTILDGIAQATDSKVAPAAITFGL